MAKDLVITTKLGGLWDARTDLRNLTGILAAILYLSGKPDDDDPAKADIILGIVQIQETVARCAEALHDAIEGGKISETANN